MLETHLGKCIGPRRQCTAGLYLAWVCVRSCDLKSCAHCPSHCKLSQLAAFQWDGPEWSTPRKFHCSYICGQTTDNVLEHCHFLKY